MSERRRGGCEAVCQGDLQPACMGGTAIAGCIELEVCGPLFEERRDKARINRYVSLGVAESPAATIILSAASPEANSVLAAEMKAIREAERSGFDSAARVY